MHHAFATILWTAAALGCRGAEAAAEEQLKSDHDRDVGSAQHLVEDWPNRG